ncbi:serine protease [Amycolatopsis sp. FDAARGOS 1241]|uniref:trypsin-like serine peptidase n=1 Tax=Amycolatopsis sp. FDAARGOS 1241 TaxID=2778070 RepID=UPI00194DCC3F|nr:trypsin-like peptidase domain-containing protein [Amycolatopsis sp. FDAARGOS 1241]QRP47133.1 trypsin-like peptidase domain-containing protein [Amycolatopsis sp. FDAARGOS 1241]
MTILKLRRTLVMLTTVVAAAAAVPAVAAAAEDGNQVTSFSTADRAAALAYWTPERMKAVGADTIERVEQVAKPWPNPAPKGVGRLFFTEASPGEPDQDSWCTATAVPSATGDVVVTAGHCAYAGTNREDQVIRVKNSVFVPGYDQGRRPHGVFATRALAFRDSYATSSDPDVAMVVLDPQHGQHVAAVAGTQQISFDHKGKTQAAIFGYPGSKAFFGESPEWCDLPVQQDAQEFDHWQSTCDMAGGSSGGPWFANFNPATASGLIFSVNSRGATEFDESTGENKTLNLEGAPLEADAKALYDAAGKL